MKEHGLKYKLKDNFGKFSRTGSVWRWKFLWVEGKKVLQDGYDQGEIKQKQDMFERLKVRFFRAILLHSQYYKKAYYFKLYLCDECKENDIHVFDLSVQSGYRLEVTFTEEAKKLFSQDCLDYILSLAKQTEVEIQAQIQEQNKKGLSELIKETNEMYSKKKIIDKQAKVQTFWEQLVTDCFPKDVRFKLATIKATVKKEATDKEKGIVCLCCIEEQLNFLESNLDKWADYFIEKTKDKYDIEYNIGTSKARHKKCSE